MLKYLFKPHLACRLNIEVAVYCGVNFYGTKCEVNCIETNDCSGHYSCDPDTGSKVCLDGWEGAGCTGRMPGYDDCPVLVLTTGQCFVAMVNR